MGKSGLIIAFWVILMSAGAAQTQPVQRKFTRQDYIEKYKYLAVKEMLISGVPASITLAQGLLESGDGNSTLALKANNHFGIKCHGDWEGNKYYMDDDRKGECFRVYESVFDSYRDHSEFLKTRERYAELFTLKRTDYKAWARGLKKAGYATNPDYPQLLIKIIEDNNLHQYDEMSEVPENVENDYAKADTRPDKKEKTAGESEFTISTGREIQMHPNHIKFVVAKAGDNFGTFEKLYEVRKWQLTKYNDLPDNYRFQGGETVFLQPKRNRAKEDFHFVVEGETMKSISQQYGIKLKKLYRKNHMTPGTQPQPGQKLWLRKIKPE